MNDLLIKASPGIVQAITVTVVGHPFDTVKTQLQSGIYKNNSECIRNIMSKEGPRGFYKGSIFPLISHLVKRPCQFPVYEWLLKEKKLNTYLAGAISGFLGTFVGNPLQVMKIRKQLGKTGPFNPFQGFVVNVYKDVLFGSMLLGTYGLLRKHNGTGKFYKDFLNGASAHCFTWAVLLPVDYVKTNIQKSDKKVKIVDLIRSTKNPRVYWTGLRAACLRTIPVSGFGMASYEYVKKLVE